MGPNHAFKANGVFLLSKDIYIKFLYFLIGFPLYFFVPLNVTGFVESETLPSWRNTNKVIIASCCFDILPTDRQPICSKLFYPQEALGPAGSDQLTKS